MLTINDVMLLLQVSKTSIYQMCKTRGFPPSFKVGGSARWDKEEIDEWLEQQKAKRFEPKPITKRGRPTKV
ncbi:MAG: helix-turn-helix transcriptional regulator [Methylophilaceae bacterium]